MSLRQQFEFFHSRDLAVTTEAELVPFAEMVDGYPRVIEPITWRRQWVHWGPRAHQCYLRDSDEGVAAAASALACIRPAHSSPRELPVGSRFD